MKQLQKQVKNAPQLLSQMTQKYTNQYGDEELVQKIREVLVKDLEVLSVFNGTFAVSK